MAARRFFPTSEEAEYPLPLCLKYAEAMVHALKEWEQKVLPARPSAQTRWLTEGLMQAAARLRRPEVLAAVLHELKLKIGSLAAGHEYEHLMQLLAQADRKGSDVHLEAQALVDSEAQSVPYPACCWDLQFVHSCA